MDKKWVVHALMVTVARTPKKQTASIMTRFLKIARRGIKNKMFERSDLKVTFSVNSVCECNTGRYTP